jgi:hypothetical protein
VYDIYGMTEKKGWLDYWKPAKGNRGANGVESSNHDVCLAKVRQFRQGCFDEI